MSEGDAITSNEEEPSSISLTKLCDISMEACQIMTPLIRAIYATIGNDSDADRIKTFKKDNSAFTIADGAVQYLLEQYLFGDSKELPWLEGIVGEEECTDIHLPYDNIDTCEPPYRIDGLEIPSKFNDLVEESCRSMTQLRTKLVALSSSSQQKENQDKLTIFIDPIDGTREFSSGTKGDQCSICIGFASSHSKQPVAGVVYRPLSQNPDNNDKNGKYISTWAAGAKRENYFQISSVSPKGKFDKNDEEAKTGFLVTSNGSISPFLSNLMEELKYQRYPSGGAGNKILLLLEQQQNNKNIAYILDRGVSRWDTCAAQAVLEAQGGSLVKLDSFLSSSDDEFQEESYTYQIMDINLDMPKTYKANLTKYNAAHIDESTDGKSIVTHAKMVKEYSNICGMVALPKEGNTLENKKRILNAMKTVCLNTPPSLD